MTDKMTSNWWTEKEKELSNKNKMGANGYRPTYTPNGKAYSIFKSCRQQHEKEMQELENLYVQSLEIRKEMVTITDVEKAMRDIVERFSLFKPRIKLTRKDGTYEYAEDFLEYLQQSIRNLSQLSNPNTVDSGELKEQKRLSEREETADNASNSTDSLCYLCGKPEDEHPIKYNSGNPIQSCNKFTPKKAEEKKEELKKAVKN